MMLKTPPLPLCPCLLCGAACSWQLVQTVQQDVAVVVYDWKSFTMPDLVMFIKRVLGASKVTSVAVVAPGMEPGAVSLLESVTTTSKTLKENVEMAQFWRVVAGCVSAR
jgi:hypothetical protein